MKYFLIWLKHDIKNNWARKWPQRKKTISQIWQGARHVLLMGSWLALFIGIFLSVLDVIITGKITNPGAVIELVFGVLLLNATFYLGDKLEEYREEKERLLQQLKD